MSRICILGAGFIGMKLVESCLVRGHDVTVLSRGKCPAKLVSNTKWIQGDFESIEKVTAAVRGSEIVFHLISSTVPGDEADVSLELFSNVSQTLQLLEVCVREKISRVIFVSSSSVYGLQSCLPVSESAIPSPISAHGIQKLTLEYYFKLFKYEYNLDCKIMRLANPFGWGQDLQGRQGFISILIGNILRGEVTSIRGDGETIRDFINISDVVDACFLLAFTDSQSTLFNMGSGRGVSLNSVVSLVGKLLSRSVDVQYIEKRSVDISSSVMDIRKAKKILGFQPVISLEKGLEKYLMQNNLL